MPIFINMCNTTFSINWNCYTLTSFFSITSPSYEFQYCPLLCLSLHVYLKLASKQALKCVLGGSSIFFGKKLIIYVYYNLGLLHFPITKKPRGVIYWLVYFFLLLSGLTHYLSVCVLSCALSSSDYFCMLFFLHLSLTLYCFVFILGWHIHNFVRLHSSHIGWIRVSEVAVNLSSSC